MPPMTMKKPTSKKPVSCSIAWQYWHAMIHGTTTTLLLLLLLVLLLSYCKAGLPCPSGSLLLSGYFGSEKGDVLWAELS